MKINWPVFLFCVTRMNPGRGVFYLGTTTSTKVWLLNETTRVVLAVCFIAVRPGLRALTSHCKMNSPSNKHSLHVYDISESLPPSSYLNGLLYRKREVTSGQRLEWRTPSQGSSSKCVGIEKLFRLKVMNQ